MATIALYANKINQMPGLIKDIKRTVTDYKSELSVLKTKTLTINKSVCNLDDVISSIQTSTQTQEQKIDSLDTFNQNSENFISDVVRIDSNVADVVKQRKDDFYNQYYYLKPECEKNGWEKFCDGLASAGDWCKEHWKLVVAVVIVVAAIVCLFIPGVNALVTGLAYGKLLLAMASGALIGAGAGGLLGGTMSAIAGGSFWEGFENGAFYGAIAGLISGGMTFVFTGGVAKVSLTFGRTLLVGAVSGGGSSLIGDLGDKLIKGTDISWGQMLLNTAFAAAFGATFAGVFYGLSKGFAALKLKFSNGKANLPKAVGTVDDAIEGAGGAKGELCFIVGTLIAVKSGYMPIESINVGDEVLTWNEEDNLYSFKKVLRLFFRKSINIVRISIADELIEATEEHPFFVEGKGWTKAKHLSLYDNVVDRSRNPLFINKIERVMYEPAISVYNFEVEKGHTYFVSKLKILVHNKCGTGAKKWHKGTFDSTESSFKYHYEKHGASVGAKNPEQYLNKAEGFAQNLRGSRTKVINDPTPGVVRHYKNGRYIDIAPDGSIISFGLKNK